MPSYKPGKDASQAEAEHGITNAIKLASNETPWPPVDSVLAAVADAAAGCNRYADHRATALRAKIATWVGVDPSNVTVGCGSVGLLQQLALTYVDPGDQVVYPWRSFEVYPVYSQLVNAESVTPALRDHTADVEAIAAAVGPRTKLILLANPNNPTGTAVPVSDIGSLLDSVPTDVIVVVDEAYREFMDPALGDPVSLLATHQNLVVLRTFSKAQGLAGFRVGYALGHPDVIASIDKTLFPFAVNAVAQAAAVAAIDAAGEIAGRVALIVAERVRVVAELRSLGFVVPDPQANFVYLPLAGRTEAVYVVLEKLGVVTRPFAGEGLRITIGTVEQNDRFLRAIAPLAP